MKKIASIICLILLINSFAFDVQADEDQNMEQEQKTVTEENETEVEIGEDESQIKEENSSLENIEEESEVVGENAGTEEGALQQESQDSSDNYVIWGTGRGITNETIQSKGDCFGVADDNGRKSVFEVEKKEKEWIFESDFGTIYVKLPILNAYIAANGEENLGAPISEQQIKDGYVYQSFENGNLTYTLEDQTDTFAVRRGNVYYFKYAIENGEADKIIPYGKKNDVTLAGDWNGDGVDTLCVRRGQTYYIKNSLESGEADEVVPYGKRNDQILVGDWDGDGVDTLCVRRGQTYYIKNSLESGEADEVVSYGKRNDQILVGDWDGDGVDTLCVRRGQTYYIKNSLESGEADEVVPYGKVNDQILAGDWDGDGVDTLCVRRGQIYYIKNNLESGEADKVVAYGKSEDEVYVGKWKAEEILEEPNVENIAFNNTYNVKSSKLTTGFAGNAINGASFRKNAITTYIDDAGNEHQIAAYYDYYGTIVLAKRVNEGQWFYEWTGLKGDITDAHNTISVAVDGDGYIHLAWGQHARSLNYAHSEEPLSLKITVKEMIGDLEKFVTYPEFYNLPNGDLFFLYRDGGSGNGNLVLNKYHTEQNAWERVQDNLISGEGERSPYWQAVIDYKGRLHISWVWRETTDVSTNYNISYMVSTDMSGTQFQNSKGELLILPVIEDTAEVICEIPQNSSLINQTSMTVDENDMPYIVSYWRVNGIVQYNVIRFTGEQWIIYNTDIRSTDFVLSGISTQKLPCARPQILVSGSGENANIFLIFRDDERNSYASIAKLSLNDTEIITEKMIDITNTPLGEWEPNYDINLWNDKRKIVLLLQKEYYTRDGIEERYKVENVYAVDISTLLD